MEQHKSMVIEIVNVAAVLKIEGGIIHRANNIMKGRPTSVRARVVEDFLKGYKPDKWSFLEAEERTLQDSNPGSSSRASEEYQLALMPGLVGRALKGACLNEKKFPITKWRDEL